MTGGPESRVPTTLVTGPHITLASGPQLGAGHSPANISTVAHSVHTTTMNTFKYMNTNLLQALWGSDRVIFLTFKTQKKTSWV